MISCMAESLADLWPDCWINRVYCFTLCECDWESVWDVVTYISEHECSMVWMHREIWTSESISFINEIVCMYEARLWFMNNCVAPVHEHRILQKKQTNKQTKNFYFSLHGSCFKSFMTSVMWKCQMFYVRKSWSVCLAHSSVVKSQCTKESLSCRAAFSVFLVLFCFFGALSKIRTLCPQIIKFTTCHAVVSVSVLWLCHTVL